jgi:hypothetical protein
MRVDLDFYSTMAQVLPVLLLALMWDSNYLLRLRRQPRVTRRDDPSRGVVFWTKPRVRIYSLALTAVIVVGVTLCFLVLADLTADSVGLRVALIVVLVLGLATLVVRIGSDVVSSTR